MKTESSLKELANACCLYLEQLGYGKHGVWANNYTHYNSVVKYLKERGVEFYDTVLADEYVAERLKLYDEGKISRCAVNNARRAVEHLTEFTTTGQITRLAVKRGTKYNLNENFENLLTMFLESRHFHPNTKEDFKWAIRFFLFYCQERSKFNTEEYTETDLKEFVLYASKRMTFGSLNNLLGYTRQFLDFLKAKGLFEASTDILKYNGKREYHVSGYVSDEDLTCILKAIDTRTAKGKRNNAIILLGATTGMRAADIVSLKLSDIDWCNGIIVLKQSKTGKHTRVPLTEDVALAIQDYILNARHESEFEEVFLRINAPFIPLKAGSAIESIFEYQYKVSGIKREPFDGRAFHGLRRRLGRKMLMNGEEITTISQVLGHTNTRSAKQYLKIDSNNLKACALDFNGIGVERRSLI